MRATLLRFSPEVLDELKYEAALAGVSVAQYVREAVVARIAYAAGRRGDADYGPAMVQTDPEPARVSGARAGRSTAARVTSESAALRALARHVNGRATDVAGRASRSVTGRG